MYEGDYGCATLRRGRATLYRAGLASLIRSIDHPLDSPTLVIGFKDLVRGQQLALLLEVTQALLQGEVSLEPTFLRDSAIVAVSREVERRVRDEAAHRQTCYWRSLVAAQTGVGKVPKHPARSPDGWAAWAEFASELVHNCWTSGWTDDWDSRNLDQVLDGDVSTVAQQIHDLHRSDRLPPGCSWDEWADYLPPEYFQVPAPDPLAKGLPGVRARLDAFVRGGTATASEASVGSFGRRADHELQ